MRAQHLKPRSGPFAGMREKVAACDFRLLSYRPVINVRGRGYDRPVIHGDHYILSFEFIRGLVSRSASFILVKRAPDLALADPVNLAVYPALRRLGSHQSRIVLNLIEATANRPVPKELARPGKQFGKSVTDPMTQRAIYKKLVSSRAHLEFSSASSSFAKPSNP